MKNPTNYFIAAVLGGQCWLAALLPLGAEENVVQTPSRTQVIDVKKGWNAVFLEVEPPDAEPAAVFAGLPVDIAAAHIPNGTPMDDFITNPEINLAKGRGWGVWYSEQRPEAFLSSLGAIYGQQAYLVHAKSAFRWSLTGRVVPASINWRPDAYNLVGFGVSAAAPPSFAEYFAGSAAHRGQPVYRLVDDNWKKVTQPEAEPMRSGEAVWVFCKGSSTYQGPLGVELPVRRGLILSGGAEALLLRNQVDHPLTATVERVMTGGNELPVSIVMTAIGDPANPVKSVAVEKPAGVWTQAIPALEAGKAVAVPFEARAGEMTAPVQGALLKITTDLGTECWVPVIGIREDLSR